MTCPPNRSVSASVPGASVPATSAAYISLLHWPAVTRECGIRFAVFYVLRDTGGALIGRTRRLCGELEL